MGPEEKVIWEVTLKSGYNMHHLYFYCLEDQIVEMFEKIKKEDYRQEVELFSYKLAGELIDYDKLITSLEGELC